MKKYIYVCLKKIWNTSWTCVSSLLRDHANLLCIVPILEYMLPKRALKWKKIKWKIHMTVLSCKTNVQYESVMGALGKRRVILAGRGGGRHDNALKTMQGTWNSHCWSHCRAKGGCPPVGQRLCAPHLLACITHNATSDSRVGDSDQDWTA